MTVTESVSPGAAEAVTAKRVIAARLVEISCADRISPDRRPVLTLTLSILIRPESNLQSTSGKGQNVALRKTQDVR